MSNSGKLNRAMIVLSFFILSTVASVPVRAEDGIENAGVMVGVTAGNVVFVPMKAISVSMGLVSGALSYVLTAGNREITHQLWNNATQGPYLITRDVATKAIGERPELSEPQPVALPQ